MADAALTVEGTVLETLRGDVSRVEFTVGNCKRVVLAKRAGRMVHANVRIVPGDRVRVELSEYDVNRGRIVYRLSGARGNAA